ncbi:hypothetical protein NP493_6666g00000 [Ridgeia piscesae]|uniref:Uncharacterized protein n=1 Tax=Ridgeia piscesae TaxID=27915 RepID=A0AAD9IR45_RIDPI|nr:hypothetical protein NP493_6666g00000 [Ridgeia piscesae]
MVLHLVNTNSRTEPWKLLVILNVNLTHVIVRALGWFRFNERSYEIMRDLALLVPDLFHVLVSRTLRTQHHGSEQGYIIEEIFVQRRDYGLYINGGAFCDILKSYKIVMTLVICKE